MDRLAEPPLFEVTCYCGAPMHRKRSRYGLFYACTTWPACDGTIGTHDNGRPLGIPADKATRAARIAAHAAFDALWRHGAKPGARKRAYAWMRNTLKLSEAEAHIGVMTIAQCHELIAAVEKRVASEYNGAGGILARAHDTRQMIDAHEASRRVRPQRSKKNRRRR